MTARDVARPINDVRGIVKDLGVLNGELHAAGLARAAELLAPYRRLLEAAVAQGRAGDDMTVTVDLVQEP